MMIGSTRVSDMGVTEVVRTLNDSLRPIVLSLHTLVMQQTVAGKIVFVPLLQVVQKAQTLFARVEAVAVTLDCLPSGVLGIILSYGCHSDALIIRSTCKEIKKKVNACLYEASMEKLLHPLSFNREFFQFFSASASIRLKLLDDGRSYSERKRKDYPRRPRDESQHVWASCWK